MENIKSSNATFNLEKSLSPLWKLTYYAGLTFDWCRPIPKQSPPSVIIRSFIAFILFTFLTYEASASVLQLYETLTDPTSRYYEIVLQMMSLGDDLITLLVFVYFLIYRGEIQAFFSDWRKMEEKSIIKGVDAGKIKRTCIIVYILYYSYCIFFTLCSIYNHVTDDEPIMEYDDLMVRYFPYLILNPYYVIWNKFKNILSELLFSLFSTLVDIVPVLVYYYAAKIVEGMKWEVKELSSDSKRPVSKSGIIYHLWSRFETLAVMVERANDLFGPIIILCQGYLFANICGCVFYSSLETNLPVSGDEKWSLLELFDFLVQQPFRLLFTISFMGKLYRSSGELLSSVALFFNSERVYCLEEKERQTVRDFLNRLNQIKLAACPSGLYEIKPSIFLTLLSLFVTYTVILLQSNGSNSSMNKVTMNITTLTG